MSTRPNPQRGRINGLALFTAAMVALTLAIGVGGNLMFDRDLRISASKGAEPKPPADARAAATAPSPLAATSAAVAQARPNGAFSPPDESRLPDGEFGKVIRQGQQIFLETGKYASAYVGNQLNCVNCHLDAGRKPDSAPLWASFTRYPAYRSKTGKVDTLASRIQGCFVYSMNGKAPPLGDEVITALETYAFWLAQGAPVGVSLPGGGYPKLKKPAQAPDYARGEKVYVAQCALCHGADGQGQRAGDHQVFPPLWGPNSSNWGAGMHRLGNAAGFIQANMPLGRGGTLTEQEAWDVAMFMNSHDRPQDPRFTTSVEVTRQKYHDSEDAVYGRTVNGKVLGQR